MNFLAHAAVARQASDDPAFVLGAVLPDLLPLAGVRLDRSSVTAGVAAGWASHHRVDAAFHAHPTFQAGVHELRTGLRSTPLATGPRRAAAHVGWELLLDDAIAGDVATVDAFRAALEHGRLVLDDPRWIALLDRFASLRPSGPADAVVLAERVHRACARRPRLAFAAEHVDPVAVVLERHRRAVAAAAPALIDAVRR